MTVLVDEVVLLVATAAGTCGRGGMEEKKPVSSQLGENIKIKKEVWHDSCA